jgi:lipoprotein-anchoring transpeptidase ErfK/SrfK
MRSKTFCVRCRTSPNQKCSGHLPSGHRGKGVPSVPFVKPFVLCLLLAVTAYGQKNPPTAKAARLEAFPPDSDERREMTRVQILLDQANFRPGKIDGMGGEFTQRAADRYALVHGLPPGSLLDTGSIPEPYTTHTVTEEDLKWVGPTASTPPEQAKLKRMPYASVWEAVAEMYHCDLRFLKDLNPGLSDPEPGTVLRVPNVAPFRMSDVEALAKKRNGEALARKAAEKAGEPVPPAPTPSHRLVLLRDQRILEVYDLEDKLVASFPCTPGSSAIPVPEGTWKVVNNVLLPTFRYDKSVLKSGVPSDEAYLIPPGPNNYVGIVWMGINRRSVGMHGTNHPDQIGRNQSSGCIRLANWDAFLLCQMAVKGTPLEVR